MRTIKLEGGKYEFVRDDNGIMEAARRNGADWPVGLDNLAHNKAFNAALDEIEALREELDHVRPHKPVVVEPIADLRDAIGDMAQRYANQYGLVMTECHIGWTDSSTVSQRIYAVDSVGMRVATKP